MLPRVNDRKSNTFSLDRNGRKQTSRWKSIWLRGYFRGVKGLCVKFLGEFAHNPLKKV
jgi:hypothetical protein